MVIPQSYIAALIVMIFGVLCLGSWASTFKLGGKWRFELYYFDFAFGVLLACLILAFTVGSNGFDGFSFVDDLMHGGKRQWFYGFVAGVIFNCANMLLMASVSVAGMSVGFPVGIGTATVVGAILGLLVRGGTNPLLVAGGCLMLLAAVAAGAAANNGRGILRHEALAKAGKAKSTRRPTSIKGIILAVISGLLMGSFTPLVQQGMEGDLGLGPYAIMFVFGVGVFFSTFAFNMFFVNLAVEGEPVEIGDYFRTNPKVHLYGLSGGAIWTIGATAVLVAGAAPAGANLGVPLNFGLSQFYPILAALWGILVWKEFSDADMKVKLTSLLMLVFYVCGLVLLSVAPLFVKK
jgi:glucose uptake protein